MTSTLSPALAPLCEKLEQLSISSPWRQRATAVAKPEAPDLSDQTDLQNRSSPVRKHTCSGNLIKKIHLNGYRYVLATSIVFKLVTHHGNTSLKLQKKST